jgi:hypothetical protein
MNNFMRSRVWCIPVLLLLLHPALSLSAGWSPSEEQKLLAWETFSRYMEMLSEKEYARAYAFHADSFRNEYGMQEWVRLEEQFRKTTGDDTWYSGFRASWSHDLQNPGDDGINVLFNYSCSFGNTGRCRGLVSMYSENGREYSVTYHRRHLVDTEDRSLAAE